LRKELELLRSPFATQGRAYKKKFPFSGKLESFLPRLAWRPLGLKILHVEWVI